VAQEVYTAFVSRGETFYGTVNVVGTEYITAYEPNRGPGGAVIGILFVGIPEQASFGVVQESIRNQVIGRNVYMYVFDSAGTAIIHPNFEGQNLGHLDFSKQMVDQKEWIMHYDWEGEVKIVGFTYFAPLDWHIAAGADWVDFTGPIDDNVKETGNAAAATEEASASIEEVSKMIENVSTVANKTLQANQKFKLAK